MISSYVYPYNHIIIIKKKHIKHSLDKSMGKKRIEKIIKIADTQTRKVTQCKRKKGLLKKVIELSVLCDLKIVMLIKDCRQRRVTHY